MAKTALSITSFQTSPHRTYRLWRRLHNKLVRGRTQESTGSEQARSFLPRDAVLNPSLVSIAGRSHTLLFVPLKVTAKDHSRKAERVEMAARVLAARDQVILTDDALAFLAELTRSHRPRLEELLRRREEVQARYDAGGKPRFLPETAHVRASGYKARSAQCLCTQAANRQECKV